MPKKTTKPAATSRYSARLLFQFRVVVDGEANKRRLCEDRIITFTATHARAALREAKKRGRAAQHSYKNCKGGSVYFEFVGVLDLLHLGPECCEGEIWYDLIERLTPMERRANLIPPESELNAIRLNE